MVNHQVMIRDLDWSTKASNLVERVSNLNADAADLIQEVRVTRQGRFFPGKMRTAFVHLRDGASEEVAQQIAAILGGRVVEPKAKQQPPPKQQPAQQPVPVEQLPGLGLKRCPAPPPRPSSSASRGASSAPVTPPKGSQSPPSLLPRPPTRQLPRPPPGPPPGWIPPAPKYPFSPTPPIPMTAPPPAAPKFSLPAAWRPKVRPSTTRLLEEQQQPKKVAAPSSAPPRVEEEDGGEAAPRRTEVKVEQPDNTSGPLQNVTTKPESEQKDEEYEDVVLDDEAHEAEEEGHEKKETEQEEKQENEEEYFLPEATSASFARMAVDPVPGHHQVYAQPTPHRDEGHDDTQPIPSAHDEGHHEEGVPTSPAGGLVEADDDEVERFHEADELPEEKAELGLMKEEEKETDEGFEGGEATPWKRRTDKRDRRKKKAAAAGARAKSAAGSSSQPASGDVSGSRKPSSAAEHDADEEKAKEPT